MDTSDSKKRNIFVRIWRFYYEGFRSMTVGRTLWAIILLKLVIFFVVMKMLFFPNILQRDYATDEERAEPVRHELTDPGRSTDGGIDGGNTTLSGERNAE